MEIEYLSKWFNRFAENECKNVSPLYYQLSKEIVEDADLLAIAAQVAPRQPMPNLFLGAMHYLLLKNQESPLTQFYPSINNQAKGGIPIDLFKVFCYANKAEIIHILKTRIVQTNALNRCAYLMPIIYSLFENGTSVNLIDIGTSAGLNLNFEQYAYVYNNHLKFGKGPVQIRSEIRGGSLPTINQNVQILNKIGIDQNPLDIKIADNALWLKALIWADRLPRFQRMEKAIELAQQTDLQLVKGQSIADFASLIQAQAKEIPLVVFHTHVLYQFTVEERIAFWQMLDEIGKARDFYYLAVESAKILADDYGQKGPLVELTTYKNGLKSTQLIAKTNGHANWIEWV